MTIKIKNIKNKYEYLYCIRKHPVNKPKYESQEFDQEHFYAVKNNTIMLIQYRHLKNFAVLEKRINHIMPWEK